MTTPISERTTGALLAQTRLTVHAQDFIIHISGMGWRQEAIGLFVTLAALSAHGPLPSDLRVLARTVGVRPSVLKRAWPDISRYMVLTDAGYVLSDDAPLRASLISQARPSLRHFFARLVTFWGRACVYCGEQLERLAIEHIVPRARGGADELTNLTLACRSCNSRKGTRTAEEFGYPDIHDRAKGIH